MNTVDLALLIAVLVFTMMGFVQGFLRQVVSLAAIYLSAVMATQYHAVVGDSLRWLFNVDATPRAAVGFVIVFFWATLFLGWIIRHVYPTMHVISIGPLDNLGGAGLGLITGLAFACLICIVVGFVISVPWPQSDATRAALAGSAKSSTLMPLVSAYAPVLQSSITLWFPNGVPAIISLISLP
jgi:membrane protein required for colicin V production